MARQANKLTVRAVSAANKPGLYSDGGGLYLAVARGGSKSWLYRFMLRRRARDMGLGGVDVVSLAEAREKALESRKLVKAGVDPIDARNAERARQATDAASSQSFRECAERYIASHESGWRNPKHRAQWSNTLATYAYPVFGEVPVDGVDTKSSKTNTATSTPPGIGSANRYSAIKRSTRARRRREPHFPSLVPSPRRPCCRCSPQTSLPMKAWYGCCEKASRVLACSRMKAGGLSAATP